MSDRVFQSRKIIIFFILVLLSRQLGARTWTVMPVGNSLTAGIIPGTSGLGDGFRGYLKDQLGADFTFVGGDVTITAGLNGHFKTGAKIESFLPGGDKDIMQALNTYNPEIVLLHIGTNNTGDKQGPYTEKYTASYNLRELINTIGKHQSVGYILVSKIISKLDANKIPLQQIQEFNKEIERMFFDNAISAKAVLVDMNSAVSYLELGIDGIHPVPSGYERMASEYTRVVQAITNNPGDTTSPTAITIVSAEVTDQPAISLKWYTPTDQGGIVNLYELRYLVDSQINSANFAAGTIITLRRPGKNSPSSGQERTTITEGILGGRTYSFAIRVYDQANNKSSISIFNPIMTPDELPQPGIAFVDSFNNADLRGWNYDPAYQVSNGRLSNSDAGSGWGKLAILDTIKYTPSAEFVEVGARYAPGNYNLGGLGLAMLLDTDDYRIANGYMIRLYGAIALYTIVNGKVTGEAISSAQPSTLPTYGDTLSVVYRNNPTVNSFEMKINGNSIGIVQDSQKRYGASSVLYSGITLYGALANEVDCYSIKIPHLEPERMLAFGTTSISGEVDKTLGSPLSVKVLDINGVGVANVPVDFNILSGVDATLSADDVCGDFGGDYYIEAESGFIDSPMGKASDVDASGGKYISTKTYGEGLAKYTFWICEGTYDLVLRAWAPNSNSNSIYFAVDNPSALGEDATRLEFDVTSDWVWSNKARRSGIYLSEGFHAFYLQGREMDTRIDKILFTTHSGFTPSGEGGSTPKFANVTDNRGIVSTDVTFGTQAGQIVIGATSNAVPPPDNYVEFPAIRVNGGTPTSFVADSPTIIQGEAGRELSEAFAVHVSDAYGNARQGEQVMFAVVKGDGRFSGSEVAKANTDENGVAEASLKLGYEPETVIDAYLNNFADLEHIAFKGVAEAGTIPFELVRLSSMDHFEVKVNSPVPEPLRVRVLNQAGEPYSDYPVEFKITAGDGKLNGLYTSVVDSTDADGIAEVTWTIGRIAGVNAHIVRINATLNGAPMEFTTTALPDAPDKLAKLSGDNQRQGAGKTFPDSLIIQIQDQYGNGIPNYPVRFSVVPGNGDGNFEGRTGVSTSGASLTLQTNAKGFAGVLYTAGTIRGENQIIAEGMQQPQLPSKNHAIFYLTVDPPLPQSIQIVSGNDQTREVSKELAPFKVKIFDPFNNGIGADIRVKFQVTKGIAQFNNAAIFETRTDGSGVATAIMMLGQSAGEQRARVTLLDYPDVAPVEFSAMAIAGPAARLNRVSPQQFSEKAGGLVTLIVQVTDKFGNVKSGHQVLFTVTAGGGVFKEPSGTIVTATSNSENGQATVTYQMGRTTAVLNDIVASAQDVSGLALSGSPIHFQGTVLPGEPTTMAKESSDYKRGQVGSTIAEPYVVQLRDSNNNPVASSKVLFVAKSKDARVDGLASVEKTTDAEGRASAIYTIGTKAKTDTLHMAAIGYDLTNDYFIIAEPGHPTRMTFEGDSLWQKTLNNTVEITPKVRIVDAYDNTISYPQPVKFQITQGNSFLFPGTVQEMTQNSVNGVAQVSWQLGTTPQTHLLRASSTYDGAALAASPLIFTAKTEAGAPENITRVQPDSNYVYATANQPLLLRVQVTDRSNNAIANVPVNFVVQLPESDKGVLIDASGKEWTEITINSDGQGFAQLFFKPVITTTVVNRVMISVERGPNLPAIKEWVHVFGEAPTAKRMQVLSSKQVTVPANANVAVQVAAYDALSGGARVPNHTIWFSITKGDGRLQSSGSSTSTRPTNSNGVAEEAWNVGSTVGKAVLLINGNTQVGSPDSIIATVQPAAPFADSSKLTVLNEMIAGVKSIVQLKLVDPYGNPVSGHQFTLTSPDQGVSFEQPSTPTGADGATYGAVTSTKAGPIRIAAQMTNDASFRIPQIVVNVNHGAAARLELVGQNNQFVGNIGALLKEPLAVRVTDSYANTVGARQAEVKFALLNGGGSLEGENASKNNAFVRTDSLGIARVQLVMGPQANEAYLVEASLSDPNAPSVKLTFIGQSRRPVLPLTLHKVSGDSLTGKIGETLNEAFVTRVVDKEGLPVWSENNPMVRFTPIIGAGEFVDGEFVNTDKYGAAATRYKFFTGGTHSIKAFIPTGDTEVRFTAFAQAGAPSKMLPAESTTQEFVVKSVLASIKVMVTDADGNPVNDIPVSFALLSEPQQGGAFVDSAPIKTGVGGEPGIATAIVTLGEKMGAYVVLASSPNLAATEKVHFTINATPAEAYYLSVHSGDQQFGTKNSRLVYPIITRVTDEFMNPVPDVALAFWADAGQGHGQPMLSTVKTAENGLATNWWTIGNNDQNQMIVQKIGLRPSTLTVTAFGVANNFPEFKSMPESTAIFTKSEWVLPFYAEDKDNDPLTYQITAGLPSGAAFDAQTAVLRWMPTQAGQWTMHYRVDDNKPAPQRGFDVDSLKIIVSTKIEIVSSYPQDNLIKIPYDEEQEFGVIATGTNIRYKWVLNGTIVQNSNVSRYTIKASDHPRGALHSLTVTAYDADNPLNADLRSWGVRTKVELTSFSGEAVPFRGVELQWRTSHEDGNVGFDVLRASSKSGEYTRITTELITSNSGAYAHVDSSVVAGHTYYFKLEDFDIGGQRTQSEAITVTVNSPQDFMLLQNYPNPFNPRTTVRFQLPQAVDTRMVIFNVNGQAVKTLIDGRKDAGYHEIHWSGQNNQGAQVSSGVYYIKMVAGDFQATKKMVLIR